MIARLIASTALIATLGAGIVPVAASAQNHDGYGWQDGGRDGYGNRHDRRQSYRQQGYGYAQPVYDRGYYGQNQYRQNQYAQGYYPQGNYAGSYYQQQPAAYGYDGGYQDDRYRCRSNSTGAIIGAIAGGLIGNGVAGRGDRTLGTIIGGGAGALAGHAIDNSNRRC